MSINQTARSRIALSQTTFSRGAVHQVAFRRTRFYLRKLRGGGAVPPRSSTSDIVWAWAGSCVAILCLAGLERALQQQWNLPLLIGSFGASAVLVFGAPKSPLAQPRNLVGGHVLSALVGVTAFQLLGFAPLAAACVAVATAIGLMHATRTLHPPGGATALIAVAGGEGIHALGYWYALLPCAAGACVMLAVGLVVNNARGRRRYPLFWW